MKTKIIAVLLTSALGHATAPFAVAAQTAGSPCAPRDVVVKRLAEGYGETRQSVGLGANNAVVEVFASEDSGTWTITVTLPNGMTCLVASGQAYEELAETLPAKGNDA
ncbi:hypothetical protein [Marimonas arenosa]|uniref:Uncharacterized protein n=1 Tax=Marimonas arenosa TaxID=1795305 RepID=A0AAE3WG35_9RHOB|nr:hypothetical protein [Marimonas arenosa]MDQ2092097.1 hypothetical protein [Marimonas arenosa]